MQFENLRLKNLYILCNSITLCTMYIHVSVSNALEEKLRPSVTASQSYTTLDAQLPIPTEEFFMNSHKNKSKVLWCLFKTKWNFSQLLGFVCKSKNHFYKNSISHSRRGKRSKSWNGVTCHLYPRFLKPFVDQSFWQFAGIIGTPIAGDLQDFDSQFK